MTQTAEAAMKDAIQVRPARATELSTLAELIKSRLPDMMSSLRRDGTVESHLARLIPDQALVIATHQTRLAGLAALDVDRGRILACFLDPETATPDTPRRLFAELEARALGFGIRTLGGRARRRVSGFMRSLGYSCRPATDDDESIETDKDLLRGADPSIVGILKTCDELGVPEDYGVRHRMAIVPEANELVAAGIDIFGRQQKLSPPAAEAIQKMTAAADGAGIQLKLVSGFRPVVYQANLVRRKLEAGQRISQVLQSSAAPGFSEHHSGRAVDLTTHSCKPLQPEFAQTKAYQWLLSNARYFGFSESYPRNNRHGINWEPWHWYYHRP